MLRSRVSEVCAKVGRNPENVTVIAVSKLQSLEKLQQAVACGITNFGENYVQEFAQKKLALAGTNSLWHLIGPLQSNKIKNVAGQVDLIHTVDRKSLAVGISNFMRSTGKVQKVLVQVNVSGEQSKSGVLTSELKNLVGEVGNLDGIQLSGFMTMPPPVELPEQNRLFFRELSKLLKKAKEEKWPGSNFLEYLSMGTSQDFEVAIEEGATHIRVGTTIFGEREK
jgi:pyridoxal phosphate enzyme (YggS family)